MDKISISCFSPYRLDSWFVDLSKEEDVMEVFEDWEVQFAYGMI